MVCLDMTCVNKVRIESSDYSGLKMLMAFSDSPKHYTSVTHKVEFGQNDPETRKCINIEIKECDG